VFKIIIIEDNIKLRKQMKRILISKLSCLSVAEASNGKEAFLEIRDKRPHLAIIDIQLAGENGLNLTKMIKLKYPFIPVVINTNNDSPEYRSEAALVGADYFLSKKSNTINELVTLIESISFKTFADTNQRPPAEDGPNPSGRFPHTPGSAGGK
jgi:DNA-binding NarL/FixJ family response regulator